jgi:hypothetical protein
MITVALTSILVDDQDRAERFYTEILGFQVKMDFPVGAYRWLTVVSPVAPDGVQVVLEPMAHEWAAPPRRLCKPTTSLLNIPA